MPLYGEGDIPGGFGDVRQTVTTPTMMLMLKRIENKQARLIEDDVDDGMIFLRKTAMPYN
jgi:hypothetical protein